MKIKMIASCDIGGSHITVGAVDMENKKVVESMTTRKNVDSSGTQEEILEIWENAIESIISVSGAEGVAFAMPGPFDYANGISLITNMGKYENLYGLHIREYLSGKLGISAEDIVFRNDAECFLHGEVVAAGLSDEKRVLGFTLGTGLGGAFSTGGITVDKNYGSDVYKESIADEYFSTRGFIKRYFELTGEKVSGVSELTRKLAESPILQQIFDEFGMQFGEFISERAKLMQADTVIIGGNIAKAKAHFLYNLEKALQGVDILWATQGENSALLGAAFTPQFA